MPFSLSSSAESESTGLPEFPRRRRVVVVVAGLAVAAIVLAVVSVDPRLKNVGLLNGGADLHIYREGAYRIMHGMPLYTVHLTLDLLYTYTPFSTLLFIPLEFTSARYVNDVWMACNLAALYVCIVLCWRLLGYRITPYLRMISALLVIATTFLEPVRTTLFFGQINIMLMLLVLWDFSRAEDSRFRGMGIGLATGIKLIPGYFLVHALVLRQWRRAVVASIAIVASILGTWILLPTDSCQYWTATFFQSNRIGDDAHPANQSLSGVVAHTTGHPTPMWLWLLLVGITGTVSFVVVVRLHRRGERLLAMALSGLTASAVSPFSWSHHWVWFVPLFIYIVHRCLSDPRWVAAGAALYLAAGAWPYTWDKADVVVGLFLFPESWPGIAILRNMYVVVYFCVLAGAVVRAARPMLGHRSSLPASAAADVGSVPVGAAVGVRG